MFFQNDDESEKKKENKYLIPSYQLMWQPDMVTTIHTSYKPHLYPPIFHLEMEQTLSHS